MIANYDTTKFENYKNKEEQEKTESFHSKRIAFLIINNDILFLKNSTMSHLQWAKSIGISEEKFNNITRGYCLNNDMVFYKGNFEFDDLVIEDANKFASKIKENCNLSFAKVYAGLDVGNGEIWPPKKFLFELK